MSLLESAPRTIVLQASCGHFKLIMLALEGMSGEEIAFNVITDQTDNCTVHKRAEENGNRKDFSRLIS